MGLGQAAWPAARVARLPGESWGGVGTVMRALAGLVVGMLLGLAIARSR
jgi:hypothetical protein